MRRLASRACRGAALVALLALAVPISSAGAATAQQTIARLNLQRAANGLPAGIVENTTWSSGCAAHDRYMALNHTLTHYEQAGSPGYSSGGAYAGQNAVLTEGGSWDAGNPYENAPLHLDQLLAPRLSTAGTADADGFSCTTTFPGWTRPDPPAPIVYTYPGDGSTIYASEVSRELPWTPAVLAGIRQARRTGPNLIVLVDAPGQSPLDNPATLTGATLTGPSGPVEVKTVDGSTPVPSGPDPTLAPYISPGGFIIPVAPLIPDATYHGHVVVTFAGVQTPHDWTFTTRGTDPGSMLTARGKTLWFRSHSPQPIRVTFTRAGGQHAPSTLIRSGRGVDPRLSPGSWRACGHQAATATFTGYDHCLAIIVTGMPMLRFGIPEVHGSEVRITLQFGSVLHGREARLTVTPLTVRCSSHPCTIAAGRPSTRKIVLRGGTLVFPLPAPGHGLQLAIATSAFQLRDAPWTAARAMSRFVHS
jgi:hypothetical protein